MTKIHFVIKLYIKKSKFDTFKFIIFNDYQHLFDSAELLEEEDEGRVCGLRSTLALGTVDGFGNTSMG